LSIRNDVTMKSQKIFLLPVVAILICFLAVNSWSLWVDEANTAVMYSVRNFSELIDQFKSRITVGSETQQPAYIFSMWMWVKIFGKSEYALRFPNIIYMIMLLSYTFYLIKSKITDSEEKIFLAIALILIFLNPFILYNMNEARANLPTFFFSYMALLSLLFYYKKSKQHFLILCFIFAFLGSLYNLVFLFTFIGLLFIALSLSKNVINDIKANLRPILVLIILMIPLLLYYFYTIIRGGGGQIETPGVGNIGFSLFEFFGFSGLGPSRDTLREINQNSTFSNVILSLMNYLWLVIPLLLSYILLIGLAIKTSGIKYLINNLYFKTFCIVFISFFIVAFIVKFRFWGRHVIFILPLFIFFMAELIQKILAKNNLISKIFVSIFFLMLAISSYRIIYNPEYRKDDVRLAAFECKRLVAKGESIIWLDHIDTAKYYGVDKLGNPIVDLFNDNVVDQGLLVWFKKFDYYDQHGIVKKFMDSKKDKIILLSSNLDFNIYRIMQ